MSWPKGRKQPYTNIGIARLRCIRCGVKAVHQWQICADGNKQRPLCLKCDIALNELVLKWARDPDYKEKILRYRENYGAICLPG